MFHQDILLGRNPYVAKKVFQTPFPLHFHHEIELLYCLEGSFVIRKDEKDYNVSKGELFFVESMKPHEVLKAENVPTLLINLGPVFFGEHFLEIAHISLENNLIIRSKGSENLEVFRLLDEIVERLEEQDAQSEMIILSDLFRLGSIFLFLSSGELQNEYSSELRVTKGLEHVLKLVHYEYKRNITLQEAADLAGYGKSNFCKAFKRLMGISFHAYLNNYRIENAKYLLKYSADSIACVGESVGFGDQKTFCRVFKEYEGCSPGEYRKNHGIKQ